MKPAFDYRKWEAKCGRDHYCCLPCSQEHASYKDRRKCEGCGNPTEKKTRRFCDTCRPVLRKWRPAIHPPISRDCPTCNKTFKAVWRGKKVGDFAAYCSRTCADIDHSRRMSEKGNPMWKDGATPLRQQPHSARAFRVMRPLIVERDGFMCVICEDDKKLHVHHIDNWPMNNASTNLVTLCPACHKEAHRSLRGKPSEITSSRLRELAMKPVSSTSKFRRTTTSSPTEY
ncbi:putative HNH endonuclease [Brucella phage 110_141]|uniref:Putative HNH endonuclease n=15 Tax=Perisivirus TaxID=1984798 RepID=H2EI45_9CAUD|nr:putative HNH endonuclease [Brucella phage Tb]YP_007002074.1 putative HNH endonuclease [Brucella phage Pr]AHB81068.1 putative HNH endonuclease [Brucella phage Bk]AHB81124.1 putative HNH endonuclease [Brucella phage Fz]AHB81182.1 putative HNH endonuclease [Brucella phage R/C]AHB81238.1 putative HNH endonuclease [Brucella phage S708]AHB81352.1 putative HNH endonuclease [Brucella phage Wb]AKO59170.1 putative HNH endonuclease [Brucella phage 11sa_141]AKO59286.1 putative HNH endonuclease [Bruc